MSLKKYYNFDYNILDLAILNQTFFNTIHGDLLANTVNLKSYLADHFTPIIFLLLPFYYIKQSPEILLVLQSSILALAAWPLYLITNKVFKNNLLALFISILWLLNPFIHNANLFEFHLITLVPFFIFWAFYFYKKNNFKIFILFLILALLVREDIFLITSGFSILALIDKKKLKYILTPVIISVIYFVIAYKTINFFSPLDSSQFLVYYAWLGGDSLLSILLSWLSHPLQVIQHIFKWQNIVGIIFVLLPLLLIPLKRVKYLCLMIFPLLQYLMTARGFDVIVYSGYYIMSMLPGIFIALIFGVNKIFNKKYKNIIFILLAFSTLYFLIFYSPIKNILAHQTDKDYQKIINNYSSLITGSDSLIISDKLITNFSSRQNIYPICYSYFGEGQLDSAKFDPPQVDFIIIDYSDFLACLTELDSSIFLQDVKDMAPRKWREFLKDYNLIKVNNNLLLWQHKDKHADNNLDLYKIVDKPTDWELIKTDKQNILQITQNIEDKNYLIRFYNQNTYFDMPLDYGLGIDGLVSFYYYLDQDIDSYQIFAWQGNNMLSKIKNLEVDLELENITEKINFQ